MIDPFADAQAWYDRAQIHIGEYRELAYDQRHQIWTVHSQRQADGGFDHTLKFNREILPRLKPIACEAANALFQSLDNIVGAAARSADVPRGNDISWPWAIEPDPESDLAGAMRPAISKKLKTLRKNRLPDKWLALIERTFAAPAIGLQHIDVVKEVSLSGKHWELVPTEAGALAASWWIADSTQPVIVQIPPDHFDGNDGFVLPAQNALVDRGFQIMTRTVLVAERKNFQPEPISALEYASRFVAFALQDAREVWKRDAADPAAPSKP